MIDSLEESQTAALIASGRLFGRESNSGSEVVGSLEERTTATWVRGVVNSLEESRQRFLSTNPTEADTLIPASMLNIDSLSWECRQHVGDMSATCLNVAHFGQKCVSGQHEFVTDTIFLCRGFPTLVSTKNLRTS